PVTMAALLTAWRAQSPELGLHDWPPELLLALNEARKVSRECWSEGRGSDSFKPRAGIGAFHHFAEILRQLLNDGRRAPPGRGACRPAGATKPRNCFRRCRDVRGRGGSIACHDRQRLDVTRVESAFEPKQGFDDGVSASAHDFPDRLI